MRPLALIVTTLLFVPACALSAPKSATDNFIGKTYVAPPPGSLIVLIPPPVITQETGNQYLRGIEAGQSFMNAQLATQLKAAGYRVAELSRDNYNLIWGQEVAAVGGLFDSTTGANKLHAWAAAMSSLAQRVCAETKCALLIKQGLVARSAELKGSRVEWDSISMEVPYEGPGRYQFHGRTNALSVELVAIMADGEMGFRMFGGAAVSNQTNTKEVRNELRLDLFKDDRDVAAAVRIALAPLTIKR